MSTEEPTPESAMQKFEDLATRLFSIAKEDAAQVKDEGPCVTADKANIPEASAQSSNQRWLALYETGVKPMILEHGCNGCDVYGEPLNDRALRPS